MIYFSFNSKHAALQAFVGFVPEIFLLSHWLSLQTYLLLSLYLQSQFLDFSLYHNAETEYSAHPIPGHAKNSNCKPFTEQQIVTKNADFHGVPVNLLVSVKCNYTSIYTEDTDRDVALTSVI